MERGLSFGTFDSAPRRIYKNSESLREWKRTGHEQNQSTIGTIKLIVIGIYIIKGWGNFGIKIHVYILPLIFLVMDIDNIT